jgi:hypothetical protein
MDVVVGTALRCTAGKAVRVDRAHSPSKTGVNALMAHPTTSCGYAFFATGTGTPAIFTLNMPRLVRVQK